MPRPKPHQSHSCRDYQAGKRCATERAPPPTECANPPMPAGNCTRIRRSARSSPTARAKRARRDLLQSVAAHKGAADVNNTRRRVNGHPTPPCDKNNARPRMRFLCHSLTIVAMRATIRGAQVGRGFPEEPYVYCRQRPACQRCLAHLAPTAGPLARSRLQFPVPAAVTRNQTGRNLRAPFVICEENTHRSTLEQHCQPSYDSCTNARAWYSRHRIVVSTPRCGRGNPGSNPGGDIKLNEGASNHSITQFL